MAPSTRRPPQRRPSHETRIAVDRTFWGRHLWARGYFVATSGNVTGEVIAKYIEEQDIEPEESADFTVTE